MNYRSHVHVYIHMESNTRKKNPPGRETTTQCIHKTFPSSFGMSLIIDPRIYSINSVANYFGTAIQGFHNTPFQMGSTPSPTARSVWLDCDPGHDDALAILVAGYNPRLRLLGVSAVSGNQTVDKVTKNALLLLETFGLKEIDVVKGLGCSLFKQDKCHCPEIHGDSGLDVANEGYVFGSKLPSKQALPGKAVNVMFNAISEEFAKTGQKVALVCTGPLTNCAVLFFVYPEVKEMVEVVIMGGSMGVGNTSPAAEFNLQLDPDAARAVFESGVNLTMVPLQVTHIALATQEVLLRIESEKSSPFRVMIVKLLTFFAETYKKMFHFDDPPVHDPCAVVYVSNPEFFEVEVMRVDIETASALSPGQTVCDIWHQTGKPPNCTVAKAMDVPAFWNVVIDAVDCADRVSPMNQ